MGFIDNLKNIQPLEFNQSVTNNSDVVTGIVNNANDSTGGLWFIIAIWVLFIWLNFILASKEEGFVFDLPRTLLISSSWCLTLSVFAALTTITTSIAPIIWFSTIFFLSGIAVWNRQKKNL